MRSQNVILGSILSEKSVRLSEAKVYTMKVATKATKEDVRRALKDVFGVDAMEINTAITRGKIVRRARQKGGSPVDVKRSNVKKAFVQLKEGQKLPTPEVAEPTV
jgi:large subunit ribosomal protein L23